jgi:hypothetical protein
MQVLSFERHRQADGNGDDLRYVAVADAFENVSTMHPATISGKMPTISERVFVAHLCTAAQRLV